MWIRFGRGFMRTNRVPKLITGTPSHLAALVELALDSEAHG